MAARTVIGTPNPLRHQAAPHSPHPLFDLAIGGIEAPRVERPGRVVREPLRPDRVALVDIPLERAHAARLEHALGAHPLVDEGAGPSVVKGGIVCDEPVGAAEAGRGGDGVRRPLRLVGHPPGSEAAPRRRVLPRVGGEELLVRRAREIERVAVQNASKVHAPEHGDVDARVEPIHLERDHVDTGEHRLRGVDALVLGEQRAPRARRRTRRRREGEGDRGGTHHRPGTVAVNETRTETTIRGVASVGCFGRLKNIMAKTLPFRLSWPFGMTFNSITPPDAA